MATSPVTDWVVSVHSGPSSLENLTATLVAWARRRALDPRGFQLWYEHDGRLLVLRGFTPHLLSDFLAYARSQTIPPLVYGPASQRVSTPSPLPSPPPAPPPPAPPPPPPADASPLMHGVLQVLTDRETAVKPVENWLMEIFGTLDIKEADVLWSLYLSTQTDVLPSLVALAATPSLRMEGSKILGVPEELLPPIILASKDAQPEAPSAGGEAGGASESKVHLETYQRVLASNAHHWENVISRIRDHPVKEGQMSAAVLLDESEGKVTWVFPRTASPVVRAVSAGVLHLYEGNGTGKSPPQKAVLDTVAVASRLTRSLGLSIKWYLVFSGKGFETVDGEGPPTPKDVRAIEGLLNRYGGVPAFLNAGKPKKAPRGPGRTAKKPLAKPA